MATRRYKPVAHNDYREDVKRPLLRNYDKPQPPRQAIILGLVLLVGGIICLVYGGLHLAGHVISKDGAGWAFSILGFLMATPGGYVTAIAFLTWCGCEGFSYNQIPA